MNETYEFLPHASRCHRKTSPPAKLEMTTVEIAPGAESGFESELAAARPALSGETLWYRALSGEGVTRYVRLRPRPALLALAGGDARTPLPSRSFPGSRVTVQILDLRAAS